jgi:hypothetical protein
MDAETLLFAGLGGVLLGGNFVLGALMMLGIACRLHSPEHADDRPPGAPDAVHA